MLFRYTMSMLCGDWWAIALKPFLLLWKKIRTQRLLSRDFFLEWKWLILHEAVILVINQASYNYFEKLYILIFHDLHQ